MSTAGDRLQEAQAALRTPDIADEAEILALLKKYFMVAIGGAARVGYWDNDDGLVTLRAEAFRLLLEGRCCMVRTPDGDKKIPLSKHLIPRMKKYAGGVVYQPRSKRVIGDRINLWRGLGVKPAPGDWSLMAAHIHDVITNGDDQSYQYVMRWLAWAVQHPDRQAEVALVLRGGKGAGKGVLGNAVMRIFGPHGRHISNRKHLVSGFNRHLMHCSFLFADEAYWPGEASAEGELKRLITEPTLTIEPKGVDSFEVRNCLHVMISGNAEWVVPASDDERRYAVLDVSDNHIGDAKYFRKLHVELRGGGLEAMLHDLLEMVLKGWHPRKDVPETAALHAQKEQSLKGVPALIAVLADEGRLPAPAPGRPDVCLTADSATTPGLWTYAKRIPSLYHTGPKVMKTALREKWQCIDWRSNGVRGVVFPSLPELRELYTQRYGPQKHWDMTEEWGLDGYDDDD